jgi:hypothetical protein
MTAALRFRTGGGTRVGPAVCPEAIAIAAVAAAVPAAATETSDGSACRLPRSFRVSVNRPSSASRNGTGSGASPAGRWRRRQSVSHDEQPGAARAVLR